MTAQHVVVAVARRGCTDRGEIGPCLRLRPPLSSPAAIFGRNRAFCSGVPNSINVGPNRKMPFWFTRNGARAR
jgi:hypothetical protein